jgi:hypothetical protein
MTDTTTPTGPRLGADALSRDERELQQALGLSSPPAPRRTDAAFAAHVAEAYRPATHRWALASLPLAAAAAFGLLVGVPEPAPPAASGAELYALTLSALDDDDWSPDAYDALVEEPLDEDDDDDVADAEDVDVDYDASVAAAVTDLADNDVIASFDDDDLSFLDDLLDEQLTD